MPTSKQGHDLYILCSTLVIHASRKVEHLGHVTWIIYIDVGLWSQHPIDAHTKFGFDWSSCFREENLWKCERTLAGMPAWVPSYKLPISLQLRWADKLGQKLTISIWEKPLPDPLLWHIFIFVFSTMLEIASMMSVIFFMVIKPFLSMSYKLKASGKINEWYMSRHMGKTTIFIVKNKGTDQLRSNCWSAPLFSLLG